MKNFGVLLIVMGTLLVVFPVQIGGLVVGSAAVLLSLFAASALILSLLLKNVFFSIISLVFLLASFKVMDAPLFYIGLVMVVSTCISVFFKRDRRSLTSNLIIGGLGVFAMINAGAAFTMTGVILGIILIGLGFDVIYMLGFAPASAQNGVRQRVKPVSRDNVNINSSPSDYEEAEFTEIDE